MEEKRYIISEASAKTGLEAHVLRYWEEELGLAIPRNELGHRYYTESHIKLFTRLKELKDKGYKLKAIKAELEGQAEPLRFSAETRMAVNAESNAPSDKLQPDKMEQFKAIIGGIVTESLRENNIALQDEISGRVSDKVIKEMNYLVRMKEEAEEERYKKLDETIRSCQKSNREAAAGSEPKAKKKRKHRFGKA